MLGQYLLSFREALEAAVILSIVISYLSKTGNRQLTRYVWLGTTFALLASAVIAVSIASVYGGLSATAAKLFEGIAALVALTVLTAMILWMAFRGKMLKEEINERVGHVVDRKVAWGLATFSFVAVFREALETVLFLVPFGAGDPSGTVAGAVLGLASALVISFLIFSVGIRIDLRRFFYFSSLLMIFLAAGLFGYGVHEIVDYQKAVGTDTGWLGSYAFDIGIREGDPLHHKGAVGAVFAVLFGYSVRMEWARVIVHTAYLAAFIPLVVLAYRRPGLFDRIRMVAAGLKRIVTGDKR